MLDQNSPSHPNQPDEAIELFFYAFRNFTARADEILAEYGLQRVHHRILFFIGRYPQLTIQQLLSILAVSKQALHAPLRQLTEQGYILSTAAEHDRRSKQLTLSPQGQTLLARLSAEQRNLLESVFDSVGTEGEMMWKDIMRRVAGYH